MPTGEQRYVLILRMNQRASCCSHLCASVYQPLHIRAVICNFNGREFNEASLLGLEKVERCSSGGTMHSERETPILLLFIFLRNIYKLSCKSVLQCTGIQWERQYISAPDQHTPQ